MSIKKSDLEKKLLKPFLAMNSKTIRSVCFLSLFSVSLLVHADPPSAYDKLRSLFSFGGSASAKAQTAPVPPALFIQDTMRSNAAEDLHTREGLVVTKHYTIDVTQMVEDGKLSAIAHRPEIDQKLLGHFQKTARLNGVGQKPRNLILVGPRQAGKTFSLRRAVDQVRAINQLSKESGNSLERIPVRVVLLDYERLLQDRSDPGMSQENASYRKQANNEVVPGREYTPKQRIDTIMNEIEVHNDKVFRGEIPNGEYIVLEISNLNQVLNGGAQDSRRTTDVTNVAQTISLFLQKGSVPVLGDVTSDELIQVRKALPEFERNTTLVKVPLPAKEEAKEILTLYAERLEVQHGVLISDGAIDAAYRLGNEYRGSSGSSMGAALGILESSVELMKSTLVSSSVGLPFEVRELQAKLNQLDIKSRRLKRELSLGSGHSLQQELQDVEALIDQTENEVSSLKRDYHKYLDKSLFRELSVLVNKLQALETEIEGFTKSEFIDEEKIPAFDKKKKERDELAKQLESGAQTIAKIEKMIGYKYTQEGRPMVTDQTIVRTVARKTNESMDLLNTPLEERIYGLGAHLKSKVFNQEDAIDAYCEELELKISKYGYSNQALSMMFIGASGVGKTELVKETIRYLFGESALSEKDGRFLRTDGNDKQEKHQVTSMLGASAMYVGYGDPNDIIEFFKNNQGRLAFWLLDEIDKAHPAIYEMIMKIQEEKQITSPAGEKISVENLVILGTSNAGAKEERLYREVDKALDEAEAQYAEKEVLENELSEELKAPSQELNVLDERRLSILNKINKRSATVAEKASGETELKAFDIQNAGKIKALSAKIDETNAKLRSMYQNLPDLEGLRKTHKERFFEMKKAQNFGESWVRGRWANIFNFKRLEQTSFRSIIKKFSQEVKARAFQSGIQVVITEAAEDSVIAIGNTDEYGARDLKAKLNKTINRLVAKVAMPLENLERNLRRDNLRFRDERPGFLTKGTTITIDVPETREEGNDKILTLEAKIANCPLNLISEPAPLPPTARMELRAPK